jgi:membrane protease YdiL (CAAX protease family)
MDSSTRKSRALATLGVFAGYLAWIAAFRLLSLTVITYLLLGSQPRFQDISDVYGANEIPLMAAATLGYLALLVMLHPLGSTTRPEIVTLQRLKSRFLPGMAAGLALGAGVVAAFIGGGLHRWLGSLVSAEEATVAMGAALLRILSLVILVYGEEYLFRQKLLSRLRLWMSDLSAVLVASLAWTLIKFLQFDLGWMQALTLGLAGIALGLGAEIQGDFARGAGRWAAMLILFHPILSLPILGADFQGLLLVRYEPLPGTETETFRILTGGAGGPLSSLALQLLLAAEAWQLWTRNKKILTIPGR